jgi:hypothetical protein
MRNFAFDTGRRGHNKQRSPDPNYLDRCLEALFIVCPLRVFVSGVGTGIGDTIKMRLKRHFMITNNVRRIFIMSPFSVSGGIR